MIVADANVVAYLILKGDNNELARAVYFADPEWHLPALWRHEYLNVLVSAIRFRKTPLATAESAWEQARALFASAEHEVEPKAAMALAVRYGISAYDAQYVALAEQLDVTLVTQDGPLRSACPERAISMQAFCDAR
ncbi:MAG TPA: type II toxin-antitoxin system VapC family toxin [Thermoanaerobaculia bacterium]|nr:type II toxin-antitoxin system VapC family toxin [Thermoanaerobaculia bacterium]